MDINLTGRVEDHILHYAFEVDGVKRKGNFSAASSELEASASVVFIAIKNAAELYPDENEFSLHTDIEKPLGYLDGTYKQPTTDTLKRFVKAVDKIKKEYEFTLQVDTNIPKEIAEAMYSNAFDTTPESTKKEEKAIPETSPETSKTVKKEIKISVVPEEVKPAPIEPKSSTSRWIKGAKAKQTSVSTTLSTNSTMEDKLAAGEWIGWDERGVMMSYPTLDDVVNHNGTPIYANGQKPPADSMGYRKPESKTTPKQNTGTGSRWMRKGVTFETNPLDAPKREPKSEAFEGWHDKISKPKWAAMALDVSGRIIGEINSRNLPESAKKDAEYMADWWEQVEKFTVIRDGLEKGKNDFSHVNHGKMTAVDISKNNMIVWKNGVQIYDGNITDDYKRKYVESHNDEYALAWASELQAKEQAAKLEEEHYEQMKLDFTKRDGEDEDETFEL